MDTTECRAAGAPDPRASDATPADRHVLRPGVVVLGALVVAAIALRGWFALGPLGRTANSDEAIVGLMALRLLRHHRITAFYWGQAYGGSLEAMLVAPFVALFGTTRLALRFASVLLELGGALLVWRIARHLFDRRTALWAGIIALWFPLALVYFGTQERGFYPLTVVLGLTTVLMAVDIDENATRRRHWLALGLAAGIGWWVSPNILYYAIPAGVWLAMRGHWRELRNVAVAAGAFAAGASVWIVANVHSGLASGHVPNWAGHSTYWSRFRFFWGTGVPFALGLRRPWGGQWYWNPTIGRLTYAVALIAIAWAIRRALKRPSIDIMLLVVAPFVFAYFPSTWLLSEGRYLYFIASVVPFLLCRMLVNRWGGAFVIGLVAIGVLAFASDYHRLDVPISADIAPMTHALEHDGYHTAIANYWIAYRMTYQSSEHMVASPVPGQSSVRFHPYLPIIFNSNPAYVFDAGGKYSHDAALLRKLRGARIRYQILRTRGDYAVLPEKRFITAP